MSTLLQDLRYGFRMLFKNPSFSLVAILTLALGIGANSAIFSVVNSVLLRPLQLPEADRLVILNELFLNSGGYGTVSVPNLHDWREQNTVFEHIAAYTTSSVNLQSNDNPVRLSTAAVTSDYLDTLGVRPIIGRTFLPGEDSAGSSPVVVLSERLWRRSFGGDTNLIGKTINLAGRPTTVIGVMPDIFRLPSRSAELWEPLIFDAEHSGSRGSHAYFTIARMKPGVTIEQAREQMATIAHRLEMQYPDSQTGRGVRVMPLQEELVGYIRQQLLVLFAAVGFVLLIACANIANLLLARGAARKKEIAIRTSLGAGTLRLARQFIVESLLLAIVGGLCGLVLAKFGVSLLTTLGAGILPRINEIGLDWQVVGFTAVLALVTGICFGLVPAFQAMRIDVQGSLKQSGSATTGGPGNTLFRNLMVITEIAATLVLLVGAGLMIKSFANLEKVQTGFKPDNLLTLRLSLPLSKYPDKHSAAIFYKKVLDKVSVLPGVKTAGAINMLPIQSYGWNGGFSIAGHEPFPVGNAPWAEYRAASPDYFKAMEIPMVSGRSFTERDTADSSLVFIVNQRFASQYWPNGDAVGHQISLNDQNYGAIVGVVQNVKQSGVRADARMEVFVPFEQVESYAMTLNMSMVVRTESEPASLTSAIRKTVLDVDPMQPIFNVQTMESVIADSFSDTRVYMLLLGVFAGVATILAVVGIYGVIAYLVSQRTHEIGIRVALGAQRGNILKMIVGHGATLALVGVVIGLGGAWLLTGLMSGLLFGVRPTDPLTYLAVSLLLAGIAVLASYIPARRATRVDPITALRSE